MLEQASGYDAGVDIWALGITAFELITGAPPYTGEPPMKVMLKILQGEPLPLPEASAPFRELVAACLVRASAERAPADKLLEFAALTALPPDACESALLPIIGSLPELRERQAQAPQATAAPRGTGLLGLPVRSNSGSKGASTLGSRSGSRRAGERWWEEGGGWDFEEEAEEALIVAAAATGAETAAGGSAKGPAGVKGAGVNAGGVNGAGVSGAGVNGAGVNSAGVNGAGVNGANGGADGYAHGGANGGVRPRCFELRSPSSQHPSPPSSPVDSPNRSSAGQRSSAERFSVGEPAPPRRGGAQGSIARKRGFVVRGQDSARVAGAGLQSLQQSVVGLLRQVEAQGGPALGGAWGCDGGMGHETAEAGGWPDASANVLAVLPRAVEALAQQNEQLREHNRLLRCALCLQRCTSPPPNLLVFLRPNRFHRCTLPFSLTIAQPSQEQPSHLKNSTAIPISIASPQYTFLPKAHRVPPARTPCFSFPPLHPRNKLGDERHARLAAASHAPHALCNGKRTGMCVPPSVCICV
jgi:hypothetical protein